MMITGHLMRAIKRKEYHLTNLWKLKTGYQGFTLSMRSGLKKIGTRIVISIERDELLHKIEGDKYKPFQLEKNDFGWVISRRIRLFGWDFSVSIHRIPNHGVIDVSDKSLFEKLKIWLFLFKNSERFRVDTRWS